MTGCYFVANVLLGSIAFCVLWLTFVFFFCSTVDLTRIILRCCNQVQSEPLLDHFGFTSFEIISSNLINIIQKYGWIQHWKCSLLWINTLLRTPRSEFSSMELELFKKKNLSFWISITIWKIKSEMFETQSN